MIKNNSEILKIILLLLISLPIVGCDNKKAIEKEFHLKAMYDFETLYTLLPPKDGACIDKVSKDRWKKEYNEFIKSKDYSKLITKQNEYAVRLLSIEVDAEIRGNDWSYVNTRVNYHFLDMPYDMVAEEDVTFQNIKENKLKILSRIYYFDTDNLNWHIIKTQTVDVDMKNEKNNKVSKAKTWWGCDFDSLIEQCIEDNPETYKDILSH